MNISSKTLLASTLLVGLFAATTAQADKVGDLTDYADNSVATESVEIKKVSFEAATIEADHAINR